MAQNIKDSFYPKLHQLVATVENPGWRWPLTFYTNITFDIAPLCSRASNLIWHPMAMFSDKFKFCM